MRFMHSEIIESDSAITSRGNPDLDASFALLKALLIKSPFATFGCLSIWLMYLPFCSDTQFSEFLSRELEKRYSHFTGLCEQLIYSMAFELSLSTFKSHKFKALQKYRFSCC